MPAKGTSRGPIFTINTDMFLELWKNNQLAFQKENKSKLSGVDDLREDKEKSIRKVIDVSDLHQNFRSLCLNVFDRSCSPSYNTEKDLEAVAAKDEDLAANRAATKKADKEDAAYRFIKDKVLAKAKNLYKEMAEFNSKILLPIGYSARNHGITSGPKGRDWEEEADRWG